MGHLIGVICGTIIDYHDLEWPIGLSCNGLEAFFQVVGAVVGRDRDTDEGPVVGGDGERSGFFFLARLIGCRLIRSRKLGDEGLAKFLAADGGVVELEGLLGDLFDVEVLDTPLAQCG